MDRPGELIVPQKTSPKPPPAKRPHTKERRPAPKRKLGRPKKRGRPPFRPTADQRRLVESMVAIGIEQDHIGELLVSDKFPKGIGDDTLRRYFKREIRLGTSRANVVVADNLFKIATAFPPHPGTVTAAFGWLNNRAGWTNRHSVEGGDPKKPISVKVHEPITDPKRLANIAGILAEAGAFDGKGET